jgi:hypothetical protein
MPALSGGQLAEGDAAMRVQGRRESDTVESELSALPQNAALNKNRQLVEQPVEHQVVILGDVVKRQ